MGNETPSGVPATDTSTQQQPTEDPKRQLIQSLTAADLKGIPWIQDAVQKSAKLDKLERERADAEAKAEREKLAAQGRVEEIERTYRERFDRLELETAFLRAGINDPRAFRVFESERLEGEAADVFAARMKADEKNALYFRTATSQQAPSPADTERKPITPPPASGGHGTVVITSADQANDLLKSEDPSKRQQARAWKREKWVRENSHG